jgi:hypothetical protein
MHMLSQLNRTMGEELEQVSTPKVGERVFISDIVPHPAPKRTGEAFQLPDSTRPAPE